MRIIRIRKLESESEKNNKSIPKRMTKLNEVIPERMR
jgi:hypothetical protein